MEKASNIFKLSTENSCCRVKVKAQGDKFSSKDAQKKVLTQL